MTRKAGGPTPEAGQRDPVDGVALEGEEHVEGREGGEDGVRHADAVGLAVSSRTGFGTGLGRRGFTTWVPDRLGSLTPESFLSNYEVITREEVAQA